MPYPRLSKPQKEDLIDEAIRLRDMRAAANRKAKAKREADGYVRLERSVLSDIVPELRRIIAPVIAARIAGEKVVLHVLGPASQRDGQYAPETDAPDLRDGSSEGQMVTVSKASGNRRAKKRAQTARRRARAAEQGYIRATCQVPRVWRKDIGAMVDRIATALEYGAEVRLEIGTSEPEAAAAVAPTRHCAPSVPAALDSPNTNGQPYEAHDDPFRDVLNTAGAGTNTLFWDIKAASLIAAR